MRILVGITNYGDGNRQYVERLIREYRTMSFDVDIVILSDRPKSFEGDVAVRVGVPSEDPWSLGFAHKQLFAEQKDNYDLFIYSEDDTLITEANIRSFVEATAVVPFPRIVGFMRYEEDEDGKRYSSTVHSAFRWKPETVERFGPYTVAEFTNEHAAAYILTREQLRTAIDSGGFLVPPHKEFYDLLCTAATDPYTQCGMRKVVCISHLDDFLLHHMPNKYIGKLGVPLAELQRQISALQQLKKNRASNQLFPTEKSLLPLRRYDKQYYEPPPAYLAGLVDDCDHVLSIGCGWGKTEQELQNKGLRVTAVPLDPVIAESARWRGISIVNLPSNGQQPTLNGAFSENGSGTLLLSNVLQHVADPQLLLDEAAHALSSTGRIVGICPNFAHLRRRGHRRLLREQGYKETFLHPTDRRTLRRWFRVNNLKGRVSYVVAPKHKSLSKYTLGLLDFLIAKDLRFSVGVQRHETP